MPARAYHSTGRVPPPWGEKLLAHPFEVVQGIIAVAFGAMLIAGEAWKSYVPSPPVEQLSTWQAWTMGGSLLAGGIAIITSMLAPMPDLEAEYLVERAGLLAATSGWVTYAAAVYVWDPSYGGALVLGIGSSICLMLRFAVSYIAERGLCWVATMPGGRRVLRILGLRS